MTHPFLTEIEAALGAEMTPDVAIRVTEPAHLPAYFDVGGLAVASVQAAGAEAAAVLGARSLAVDQRRALMWFGMTLRPQGWEVPSPWDPIAGDYATRDGWIRLHTNAPYHRAAALSVLGCAPLRDAVGEAVLDWDKDALEGAVVAASGAAAAMHSLAEWAAHPQGRAVASEPLIAWSKTGSGAQPVAMQGLRVLDLTRVLAGPVATRFLAGYGADVLRIDPPRWGEPAVEPEVTLGKRCAGLNLHRAEDRATFEELVRAADVLVHGYRPGALAALGYDPKALSALAPDLITVCLDAYGWTGPWAGRRGFDSLVQMSSGLAAAGMEVSGQDRPVPLPVQALDHATGYLMAAAVLRAVRVRATRGDIMSARLSLARTGALLTSGGVATVAGDMAPEAVADLAPEIEATGWGPARRITFPVDITSHPARWSHPAGPLRRHHAAW